MKCSKFAVTIAFAWSGAMFCAPGLQAQDATPLPPVQRLGAHEVLTGGIGSDEVTAIRAVAGYWPLTLEFAAQHGERAEWLSDVQVRFVDLRGSTVLEFTSAGPLALVRVPAGDYTVLADSGGQVLSRKVRVGGNGQRVVLVWRGAAP